MKRSLVVAAVLVLVATLLGARGFAASLAVDTDRLTVLGDSVASTPVFFVPDSGDDKIYTYDASWTAVGSWALDSANAVPSGADVVGGDVYVADADDDRVYRYSTAGELTGTSRVLQSSGATTNIGGVAVAGDELWVVDNLAASGSSDNLLVFSLAAAFSSTETGPLSATPTPGAGQNRDARGLAIDATYIYVADGFNDAVYRYTRTSLLTSSTSKTMRIAGTSSSRIGQARGATVADTSMWIIDTDVVGADKAFRYPLGDLFSSGGNLNAAEEKTLAVANEDPEGL